jgi:4-diphosphocytidyl-2-C-methyl-D-erythritol kinase
VELLTITPEYDHNVKDTLSVSGEAVYGRNILEEVICRSRELLNIPPLHIRLVKAIPPGSGLGGGSGNAAAFLSWLHRFSGKNFPGPEVFGSDVPFLFHGERWARISGRGEITEPLAFPPEVPAVLVAVPYWNMSTKRAFSLLNEKCGGKFPLNTREAEAEIESILEVLRVQKKTGLLPNDFLPILQEMHPEYSVLFDAFETYGASGWGVTGSGSACFGLFYDKSGLGVFFREMMKYDWIRKILCLE